MNVWIVGENTIGCTDNTYGWLIDGVFDSKAAAILRCTTPKHFIGPLELNKVYPDEQRKWEGAYYPLAEPDPQPVKKVLRDPWCSLWDKQPSEKPQSNERHLFEAYAPGACVRSDICILCGHLKDDSTFHIKPAEPQLMICPKAKECGDKCEFPPHTIPHIKDNTGCLANAGISHCPACVPYVPEKWVDVTRIGQSNKIKGCAGVWFSDKEHRE